MAVTLQPIDRDKWRLLAPSFLDYNYRQLWDFGVACAKRLKATSEHVAIYDGTELVGLADVRIRQIPFLKIGIAYINGGPIIRRDEDADIERLKLCLKGLINEYVEKRGLVLRILASLGPPEWNNTQIEVFNGFGFTLSTRLSPYRTFLLDINRTLEEIRKSFAQKWRNCLNSAEKKEYNLRSGTEIELFNEFCRLFDVLIKRKKFDVNYDAMFYAHLQNSLNIEERFYVSIVDIDGQPAAGHVSSMIGDTCVYLLGASNKIGLSSKTSYVLQWHTIKTAREQGIYWYDLGGIDPKANPGVYHFKRGLGGSDITAPGPFELSPGGLKQSIIFSSEQIYRTLQRMTNKT